jgi:pyrroline-5-carboxylate reductase
MADRSVGFIGGGRVVSILLGGWRRAEAMPGQMTVFDCSDEVLAGLEARSPSVETTKDIAAAASQDVVFLGVHPPIIKEAVEAAKVHIKSDAIVVSLAPKLTIAKLAELLGGFNRIARMIPNAPSIVCRGFNPLALGGALGASEKRALDQMFQPLGECPEVDESHLEAYAILSAMGPTYFWPQIYALQSLGETFGLTSEATVDALDKMLWGTMATIRESELSSEQVQDLIPVKPMAEEIQALCSTYEQKLEGLMQRIKP